MKRFYGMVCNVHSKLATRNVAGLLKKEDGASMVEYAILLGIITAAVMVVIGSIGGKVSNAFTAVDTNWP